MPVCMLFTYHYISVKQLFLFAFIAHLQKLNILSNNKIMLATIDSAYLKRVDATLAGNATL